MRGLLVFLSLACLAVVPMVVSLKFSGDDEDRAPVTSFEEAETIVEDLAVPDGETPRTAPREPIPLARAATAKGVPVFKGFESARYQQYDRLIGKFCADFNRNRRAWAGSTAGQADVIPELSPAQVKAHIIQETGGGDLKSRTAWKHDPLQANVPGDWNPYKKYLGIKKPVRCNEGSLSANFKAGLMLLVRKGFGVSGQPASNRPDGAFDGWARALQRYNGRSDKAATGEPYSEAYSARIRKRAENPSVAAPIPIERKKR